MNNKPLVSVLMTAYNREKYIAEAIESVLASTYKNFELIIVDDCSIDRTIEIIKHFETQDNRIKVYINEKNLGDYPNRNVAASYAKGKYIKYLDSDDLIYPHGLEVMVDAMEQFPEAAFAIPGKPNEDKPFPYVLDGKENLKTHFLKSPVFIYGPSALIFRIENFTKNNGFGENTYVGSDIDIMLNLAVQYSFVKTSPSLIWWRTHENQEIIKGTLNYDYFYNYFKKMYLFLYINKSIFTTKEYHLALKKLRNLYLGKIIKLIFKLRFKPVKYFLLNNPKFITLF